MNELRKWLSLNFRHQLLRDADIECRNCNGHGIDLSQPDDACRCPYGREWKWGNNRNLSDRQLRGLMLEIKNRMQEQPALVLSVFEMCRILDKLFPRARL